MQVISDKVNAFVKDKMLFTSVDVANSIKEDGTWLRNSEAAYWLRTVFDEGTYTSEQIDVGNGLVANLYLPVGSSSANYTGAGRKAITPDEFAKMHSKKKVASTLSSLLDSPVVKSILDRTKDASKIAEDFMKVWHFDLYSRKPGPAYTDDGVFQGTDLDLACFLFALVDRGAVINIPEYKSRTARQVTEGEMITSRDNRHGKVTSLSANKESFSFSIRIFDANVMKTDSVGEFRNFMLVDYDGSWHDGWATIEFMPDAKENDFLNDKNLWTGNTVEFKNFIHPNRWVSFYGQHYITTKILIERLTEQAKWMKEQAAELRKQGFGEDSLKKEWAKSETVGEKTSIKVTAFEAEIVHPGFTGEYDLDTLYEGVSKEDLVVTLEKESRELTYTIIPKLRFATRATEYAFHFNSGDGSKKPSWIGIDWERDVVYPGKRKKWSKLTLSPELAIQYRTYEKSERVAKEQ